MNRLFSLLFALAVVATALVLAPARSAEAAPPGCFCGGYYYTPQAWGQGDTCADAEADLRAKSIAYVYCENGRCALSLVITAGCHWDGYSGKFQVDGYYAFRCWECE